MKNSTKLLGGTFALVIAAVAVASPSLAYRGDSSAEGPNCSPEKHTAIKEAFQGNNYKAWKELMNGKGRIAQVVNADNFARFAEAHKLAEEGDLEKAKAIRAELGLGLKNSSGRDQRQRENGQEKEFGHGNKSGLRDSNGQKGNAGYYSHNN